MRWRCCRESRRTDAADARRLVAHLHSTPGFTLSHLRILVVDEVDRLLRQSYQVRNSAANPSLLI